MSEITELLHSLPEGAEFPSAQSLIYLPNELGSAITAGVMLSKDEIWLTFWFLDGRIRRLQVIGNVLRHTHGPDGRVAIWEEEP
jgi:hypothetical protein